ncbi:MAG TPA: hypothetical protein PLP88_00105 [Bacteroidales bacterium]|nr:hypothetical protein [Bacteroidales bacterium]
MKNIVRLTAALLSIASSAFSQDWTHFVRTSGHGCDIDQIHEIMNDARQTHLFGIEVDNDISGRYDSFLNPEKKLLAIKAMADSAHAAGNFAFIYNAGLECITENLQPGSHSFFRDHPDWVQRNREGKPAIFGSGDAFWIPENSEDVWITPYAPEWRKIYMDQIRQIAATGIDGIYIDIPYWMTHFEGWEDTWASFDEYTVKEFKRRTGFDAMNDFTPGAWNDPEFIAWVDFRISTLTEFMAEVDKNAKSVNPACKTIAEIYPGIGEEVPRVGADVFDMYPVVDAIAHEYNVGENSARRTPAEWMEYMAGMFTFRAFAEGKPSWMLSYSWDGEEKIKPADAIANLMMSQVLAGTNSWDARRFVMSGSNDYEARTRIYQWIEANQKLIYAPRETVSPVGVYFSPKTRNYFADDFTDSYQGMISLLLNQHIEFEIVTPRTLEKAKSRILLLPDVRCLDDKEVLHLTNWVNTGKTIIVTGETGQYTLKRVKKDKASQLAGLFEGNPRANFISGTPEKSYFRSLKKCPADSVFNPGFKGNIPGEIDNLLNAIVLDKNYRAAVTLENAAGCITQSCLVNGKPVLFIANFTGLRSRENAVPLAIKDMKVTFHNVNGKHKAIFTPFCGTPIELQTKSGKGKLCVVIPEITRGGFLQIE